MGPTTTPSSRRNSVCRRVFPVRLRSAFTLVELLVVIGIMVALIAILLPMLSKAQASAKRAQIESELSGISQALEVYKNDWGDYPRTTTDRPADAKGNTTTISSIGAVVLCWALIAPGPAIQDGAGQTVAGGATDMGAPGFRIRGQQGKVYGPYLNVDHYRYGTLANGTTPGAAPAVNLIPSGTQPADDTTCVIADTEGNAILYFPGNTGVSVSPASSSTTMLVTQAAPRGAMIGQGGSGGQKFVYNFADNVPPLNTSASAMCSLTPKIMTIQLGGNTSTPVIQPYLLWSAGHDGRFGPSVDNGATNGDDDDVMYPDQLFAIPIGTAP